MSFIPFIANPSFVPRATPRWYGNVRVLHQKDIAVMKVIASSVKVFFVREVPALAQEFLKLKSSH